MAENLQEYYKRMAEAIDTQLEQKGKAALFYPVGSGSGRIVWAWINAHPDAAVIWVVPGETRRGMRLEEAKRIGQEIPPRVQLIHCEDNTPVRTIHRSAGWSWPRSARPASSWMARGSLRRFRVESMSAGCSGSARRRSCWASSTPTSLSAAAWRKPCFRGRARSPFR